MHIHVCVEDNPHGYKDSHYTNKGSWPFPKGD